MLADVDGSVSSAEERLGYFRIGDNDGEKLLKREMSLFISRYDGSEDCWDDVTGTQLVGHLVKAARKLEMTFFKPKGVFADILHRDKVKKKTKKKNKEDRKKSKKKKNKKTKNK